MQPQAEPGQGPGQEQETDLHNAAVAHYKEGEFAAALALVDRAIARNPSLGLSHYLRGVVLKDWGREDEAIGSFDRAIALGTNLDKAHYHRGTARFLLGRKDAALRDLERAVAAAPGFPFATYNLGVVAAATQAWGRAKWAFTRCLELDPANRDDYLALLVEIGRGEALEEVYAQGHRLKNLLGVVGDEYRSLLQDLRTAFGDEGVGPRASKIGEELQHLYRDMVQFLRAVDAEPIQVDLLDPRELVEKCLFALSPRLKRIAVEKAFATEVPDIIGDRKSLGEVLMNVITNAIEACQAGGDETGSSPRATSGSADPAGNCRGTSEKSAGTIRVAVRPIDTDPGRPGFEEVEVEVADTGCGIDPAALPRIFEFGYTTKRFGSGIGLSYGDRVVRAHGGRIEARSSPAERPWGTVVTLRLPASPLGGVNLKNLRLRSLLFEDLRELAIRGAGGEELTLAKETGAL